MRSSHERRFVASEIQGGVGDVGFAQEVGDLSLGDLRQSGPGGETVERVRLGESVGELVGLGLSQPFGVVVLVGIGQREREPVALAVGRSTAPDSSVAAVASSDG